MDKRRADLVTSSVRECGVVNNLFRWQRLITCNQDRVPYSFTEEVEVGNWIMRILAPICPKIPFKICHLSRFEVITTEHASLTWIFFEIAQKTSLKWKKGVLSFRILSQDDSELESIKLACQINMSNFTDATTNNTGNLFDFFFELSKYSLEYKMGSQFKLNYKLKSPWSHYSFAWSRLPRLLYQLRTRRQHQMSWNRHMDAVHVLHN